MRPSISRGSQDAQGKSTHKGTLDTRLGQAGKYDASHTQLSLTGQYRQTDCWLNADVTLGKDINGFLQATGTTGHRAANATCYQAGVAATF